MPKSVVREFDIARQRISVAPTSVSSSITPATFDFSTIEDMATQSVSSSAVTVGARLPGVICEALGRRERGMLYWQSMYFLAAMADG